MAIVTLSSKGQLVIPKPVRDSARLSAGDQFSVRWVDGELRLRPVARDVPTTLDEVAGCLARSGQKRLSERQTRNLVLNRLKARNAPGK